jgi:hypothetical protein
MLAEVGADLIGDRLGQRLEAIIRTPALIETTIAARAGGLAAAQAVILAPIVGARQLSATVPAMADDVGFHDHLVGWTQAAERQPSPTSTPS